jgi:hypothetical protein
MAAPDKPLTNKTNEPHAIRPEPITAKIIGAREVIHLAIPDRLRLAHAAPVMSCPRAPQSSTCLLPIRAERGLFAQIGRGIHCAGAKYDGAQSKKQHPITAHGSLYGAFFVKEFARASNRLSFSFFVRSQSPFLRPDPRFADVVARRSCQGWPPPPTLRHAPSLPGHTLTASSTTARLVRSG